MEHHSNKGFSLKTLIGLTLVVIIIGLFYSYKEGEVQAPSVSSVVQTTNADSTHSASLPVAGIATTTSSGNLTYVNAQYQFQFQYLPTWKATTIFNAGLYKGAIAFIKADQEPKLNIQIGTSPTSDSIKTAAADNALFFRIMSNSSINTIVSNLYGSNVVVTNVTIGDKNIAHVIRSKSSDPVNWAGGSTEAYILRTLSGQAVVVEANYSTPEPKSDTDLKKMLDMAVSTFAPNTQ